MRISADSTRLLRNPSRAQCALNGVVGVDPLWESLSVLPSFGHPFVFVCVAIVFVIFSDFVSVSRLPTNILFSHLVAIRNLPKATFFLDSVCIVFLPTTRILLRPFSVFTVPATTVFSDLLGVSLAPTTIMLAPLFLACHSSCPCSRIVVDNKPPPSANRAGQVHDRFKQNGNPAADLVYFFFAALATPISAMRLTVLRAAFLQ